MKTTQASLKRKIKELKDKASALEKDRELYRNFIKTEISRQLNAMKSNTYYTPESLVKRYTF